MKSHIPFQLFGAALVLFALTLGTKIIYDGVTFDLLKPRQKLQFLWEKDVAILKEHKQLPKFWNQFSKINIIPGDKIAAKWSEQLKVPIKINPSGKYELEILLLSWQDQQDNSSGAIIQYDVTENKSKNLIWELGRTFYFSKGQASKKIKSNIKK